MRSSLPADGRRQQAGGASSASSSTPASISLAIPRGVVAIVLFILALIPRALAVGSFTTVDEGVHWFDRAQAFLRALQAGDHAGTYLVGHPGVTTMWLGAIGELVYQRVGGDPLQQQALLRLPVAVVTSLAVPLIYLALRRLLGQPTALIAALLWATDPFMVAHAQLLHVDALLTTFITLTILLTMLAVRWDEPAGAPAAPRPLLALAASFTGALALLTKSPALILLGVVPLIVVLGLARLARAEGAAGWLRRTSLASAGLLAAMGVLVAVFWVALWPAAWADLPGVLGKIIAEARENGGSPHPQGNFFLGRAVAQPGPLFYPVALALRTTPWTMLGLLLAPLALAWMPAGHQRRRVLAAIAGFGVLFVAAVSVMAKEFDRYALPAVPALLIVAAAGLAWLWERLAGRRARDLRAAGGATVVAAGLLGANLAPYHPYELSYYSPLLGGGAAAARAIPIGWGEGYDLAAAYVMSRPDACDEPIAVTYRVLLEHMTCSNLTRMSSFGAGGDAGYVVLYIDQLQRGYYDEATRRLWGEVPPVHVVRIHDIDYAYIFRAPSKGWHASQASFGERTRLWGYEVAAEKSGTSSALTLTMQWQALEASPSEEQLFIHVLDSAGQRVAQVDIPLGGPDDPASGWRAGDVVMQTQQIPLPAGLPPSTYWVTIGVYDPQTGQRLSLSGQAAEPGAPNSGPDSLPLTGLNF